MTTVDEESIRWFFHRYRQSLANVEALSGFTASPVVRRMPTDFEAEQRILLATGLDSLAKYWAQTYPQPKGQKPDERMAEFLIRHVNAGVFSRAAAPLAIALAAKERPNWVGIIQSAANVDVLPGRVRSITEDPDLDTLAAHPAIANAGIDRGWLRRSRLGEVLYVHFRCYWLHEMSPSPQTTSVGVPFPMFERLPHYVDTVASAIDWYSTIALPLDFLVDTYRLAIQSFEQQCLADAKAPSR